VPFLFLNKKNKNYLNLNLEKRKKIMSQYIMNIDSTYRDRKQYQFSTEFGVIVNSTPGQYSAGNVYSVNNIIYARFQWNGNATTTIANDTITGNFTDFSNLYITLDPTHQADKLNYYIGCIFVMGWSGVSSVIIFYDPSRNIITLEDPIADGFYNPADTSYSIINPSNNYGNDLLLLGTNLFVNLSSDNIIPLLLLKSGPTNSLFIENVTAGWIRPIYKVLNNFRVVTFEENMPSYQNGDLFQIRSNSQLFVFKAASTNLPDSVQNIKILSGGSGYAVNDVVEVFSTTLPVPTISAYYKVSAVNSLGGITQLQLVDPGENYTLGIWSLKIGGNTTASVQVTRIQESVELNNVPPQDSEEFILYVPYINPIVDALFTITSIQGKFVFFDNNTSTVINIDDPIELILYMQKSTGLTMPLVSYKQPLCYEVSLIHLILPNQPVYGFNVLPTFFPYLMVELYNTSSVGSNLGVLYSNNPNTEKVSFYCPVGNPRNPLIVSYLIVLSSTQIQTLSWAPTDNFFFRVILPNGETLKYEFDLDINEADIIDGKVNTLATANFHFWGQLVDRRVSATFSFRLKN